MELSTSPIVLTRKQRIIRLLRIVAIAYGISVILFMLLRIFPGERLVPVAFMNSFLHLVLIPGLFILPLMLLLRCWREALLVLPSVIIFMGVYGQLFLPQPAPDLPDDTHTLTIMSYNVLAYRRDYQQTIQIMLDSHADVIAIQELDIHLAKAIQERLTEQYPYQALHPGGGTTGMNWTDGQGVLSRYPVTEDSFWRYNNRGLGNQRVLIKLNGDDIALYNVHPPHPGLSPGRRFDVGFRQWHIDDFLARSQQENVPVLLMGDFNMTDLSDAYQSVTAYYQDSWMTAGWGLGWTYPAMQQQLFPILRLDYIFHDTHFTVSAAQVIPDSGGSDHQPVLVTLQKLSN